MALRLPQGELWIETRPCELRTDCGLARYHIHVEDQIFYEMEELDRVYGKDGWEVFSPGNVSVAPVGTPLDKVKEWISLGKTDHKQHVHTSFDPVTQISFDPIKAPEIRPGDIVTVTKDGTVSTAQPGDTVAGIVVQIDVSPTEGKVTIQKDMEAFKRAHTFPPVSNHSSGGRVMDINVVSGPPWSSPSSDPLEDMHRAIRLLKGTQSAQ